MQRRDLLKMITVATGTAFIGGEFLLAGCKTGDKKGGATFNEADVAFLNEVADTILPATQTPGAKEAGTGKFITVMVNDCYTKAQQEVFHKGIGQLDEACEKMHSKDFMSATPAQRTSLLVALDKEAKEYQKTKKDKDEEERKKNKDAEDLPDHYFTMMKQLSMFGYFTSKVAFEKAFNYNPVPGKYEGCIPYKKGEKIQVGLNG
jgi:Gluconate 2-dehydrogenase subunit 3